MLATTVTNPIVRLFPLFLDNNVLVLTPIEQRKLTLFEAISGLFVIGPFSLPFIIIVLLPVSVISGLVLERWMTIFRHSPQDSVVNKIALMVPASIGMMVLLGFLGLAFQVTTEAGSPRLLESLVANVILGGLLSSIMGWYWWRYVMQHDFKGGIIISRERVMKKRAL